MSVVTADHIQKGDNIDYTPAEAVAYHQVVPLVSRVCVSLTDIAANETGTLATTGVWEFPAAASLAIAVGDKVYWNVTDSNIDKTDTGIPAGFAVTAKAAAGTTVRVKIG